MPAAWSEENVTSSCAGPLLPPQHEVTRGSRAHGVENIGSVRNQELLVSRQDLEKLVVMGPGLGNIVLLQGSLYHTRGFVLTGKQDAPIQVPMIIVDADTNDSGL